MGGRRAASLIHKQISMLASGVVTTAFYLVHRLDLYNCLYTPMYLCSHTYTTMGISDGAIRPLLLSAVYHLREAFIVKVPYMYFYV